MKSKKFYTKINLGCGDDIRKDYLNVDFEKFKGVDLVLDLNKLHYPFKDNQFEEIILKNVLEHLNDPYAVIKELYRISKNGARIKMLMPHFSSANAWGDIQHKRGFNRATFTNQNISSMFEVMKNKVIFSKFRIFGKLIYTLAPGIYEKHFAYIFPASDLEVELRVKK